MQKFKGSILTKMMYSVLGFAILMMVFSFSFDTDNLINNRYKGTGKIELKGKILEWQTQNNYRDTFKVTNPETGLLYDDYVLCGQIDICKSLNGKSCKLILNSYVHLNNAYSEKLSAYIKNNYPDNINGIDAVHLTDVVIDENGLIQYFDFSTTLGPIIEDPNDKEPQTIYPDNAILDAAVRKFVLRNRKVDVPKEYKGSPVFIRSFSIAKI